MKERDLTQNHIEKGVDPVRRHWDLTIFVELVYIAILVIKKFVSLWRGVIPYFLLLLFLKNFLFPKEEQIVCITLKCQ